MQKVAKRRGKSTVQRREDSSVRKGGHWGHVPESTKDEKGKNREKEIKNKLKRKKPLVVPESLVSAGYATERR